MQINSLLLPLKPKKHVGSLFTDRDKNVTKSYLMNMV